MKITQKQPLKGLQVRLDEDVYNKLQDYRFKYQLTYKEIFTDLILEKINESEKSEPLDGQVSIEDYLKEQKLSDRIVKMSEKK